MDHHEPKDLVPKDCSHSPYNHVVTCPECHIDNFLSLTAQLKKLREALQEIGETAGLTLLGCSHEDCDFFPHCSEEGMRGHERGANRAFEQMAGIAKAALNND
jgi:hypothetical protein